MTREEEGKRGRGERGCVWGSRRTGRRSRWKWYVRTMTKTSTWRSAKCRGRRWWRWWWFRRGSRGKSCSRAVLCLLHFFLLLHCHCHDVVEEAHESPLLKWWKWIILENRWLATRNLVRSETERERERESDRRKQRMTQRKEEEMHIAISQMVRAKYPGKPLTCYSKNLREGMEGMKERKRKRE